MCTIIVLRRPGEDPPLVVAANRDEFYSRAAAGPERLVEAPGGVGGRDLEQGGTWLGVLETGLFVGLTNQRTFAPPRSGLRSRGQVVVEALRCGSVAGVRRYLARLDPRQYNPFNLVYGDTDGVELAYARTDTTSLERVTIPDGEPCFLANDRLGSAHFPKTERAAELLQDVGGLDWTVLSGRLRQILADHELPAPERVPAPPPGCPWPSSLLRQLQALCIHTPAYGTRSATILALAPGRVQRYLFAPGPPCTTAFDDVTHLLQSG